MIKTEGASSTSASRTIRFFADIVERLPMPHPFPNIIFASEVSDPAVTFSHTSRARYTLSPRLISEAIDLKMSQELQILTPSPKAAKGYVVFNHNVWNLVANLKMLFRTKSSETAARFLGNHLAASAISGDSTLFRYGPVIASPGSLPGS